MEEDPSLSLLLYGHPAAAMSSISVTVSVEAILAHESVVQCRKSAAPVGRGLGFSDLVQGTRLVSSIRKMHKAVAG